MYDSSGRLYEQEEYASCFVRMYTQHPGDYMQRCLEKWVTFQKRPSLILFSKDPISAALSLMGFQCLLFVGGFAWILTVAFKVKEVHRPGYYAYLMEERFRQFSMTDMKEIEKRGCGWESFLELFANCWVGLVAMAVSVLSLVSTRLAKQIIIIGGLIHATASLCVFAEMVHSGKRKSVMGMSSHVFLISTLTDMLVFPLPLIRWEAYAIELVMVGSLIEFVSAWVDNSLPYKILPILILSGASLGMREFIRKRSLCRVREMQERDTAAERSCFASNAAVEGNSGQSLLSSSSLLPVSSEPSMIVKFARELQEKDLDQLYAQAVLLQPMFLSKVQAWAEASDGYFLMSTPSGQRKHYIRWRDFKNDISCAPRIKWASIKNANRAIEKILLLGGGDTSILTDIVRQTIIFLDVHQLCACVDLIINDPEVEVVRIKNRLDPSYNASSSGGYRDVGLNLRVIHEGAKGWGVAGHICELRLAVRLLHVLVDSKGHALYVSMKHVLRFRRSSEWWTRSDTEKKDGRDIMRKRRSSGSSGAAETLLPTHMSSSIGFSKSLAQERSDIALLIYKSMYPGNILDKYLSSSGYGVSKADTTSVLYSSHPLKNVLHKTSFQVLLLLVGGVLFYLYMNNFNYVSVFQGRAVYLRHLKCGFEGYSNASAWADADVAIQDLAAVKDTCREYMWTSSKVAGSNIFFSFPPNTFVNGVKFTLTPHLKSYLKSSRLSCDYTSDGKIDDPTRAKEGWKPLFTVESCQDGLGLPFCRADFSPRIDESLLVDLRFTWRVTCNFLLAVLQVFGCPGSAILARLKKIHAAKTVFASAFHVVGLIEFFLAMSPEENRQAYYLVWSVMDLSMGLILQFQERYMIKGLLVYSVITSFLPAAAQYRLDFSQIMWWDIAMSSVGLLGLVILFTLHRQFIVFKSRWQISGDMKKYNQCWLNIFSRDGAGEVLRSLKLICERVRPKQALQLKVFDASCALESTILDPLASMLKSQKDNSFSKTYLKLSKKNGKSQEREIVSLDQLYAQAILLEPMFLSKVQAWAEASDGYFLGRDGRLVRWRECVEDEANRLEVKWASIKNANRAIEKLVRSYFGRIAKLTDVLRQTIIFLDVHQLCACVDLIINDPEVDVVRIKNRLDPSYNASSSGGYRDVGLNLRVIHEGAKGWGVAGHICELQLLLEEFAALKSTDGHKRYVNWRNSRCE
ncbi:hypothetical protein GUITHDRAFT_112018 [Guillardia theta CCMP2712]|uniref:Uncharacterized protein n=1 Tax=Guillardia theta (strain CCMP2712) TaxID=905079 RepID=L1J069_GUITC|nr:hypothetical protein GUITHDRAFT_112018 [Guillardia theta CCMP2712]EKX41876.1 hypothetical protein GUITHDRAFT_112018 [Guillardia theta CCMP2712]|eukprot:XP_005828856.1 hypothetical protein GUITHDRAFT_112018 [Guillardia theta CCMP2712]